MTEKFDEGTHPEDPFPKDAPTADSTIPEELTEVKPPEKPASPEELTAFIIGSLIENAKRNGHVFENDTQAIKWAQKKFEKMIEKERLRGKPMTCYMCGKGNSDASTGPLRKTHLGYVHEHC